MLIAFFALTVASIPCQAKTIKVALFLSGPANDGGWNAVAVQGLNDAEKSYGIEIAYTEHVSVADSEAALAMADQGADVLSHIANQDGTDVIKTAGVRGHPHTPSCWWSLI